jgi:hypothetical protein
MGSPAEETTASSSALVLPRTSDPVNLILSDGSTFIASYNPVTGKWSAADIEVGSGTSIGDRTIVSWSSWSAAV